jgi:hypothetical protein
VLARFSGETGELLQYSEEPLDYAPTPLVAAMTLAASPYRFFGSVELAGTGGSVTAAFADVKSGLRYKSAVRDLLIDVRGSDRYNAAAGVSDVAPLQSQFFTMRNGERSAGDRTTQVDTGASTTAAAGGFGTIFTPTVTWTSSEWDVGKRLVITGSAAGASDATYRVTSIVDANHVVVTPQPAGGIEAGPYTAICGAVFDRRVGGIRMASNGYSTCVVSLTACDDSGGGAVGAGVVNHEISYMVLRNDGNFKDMAGNSDGGKVVLGVNAESDLTHILGVDVVWTGSLYQIYALAMNSIGVAAYRLDVTPSGLPTPISSNTVPASERLDGQEMYWRLVTNYIETSAGVAITEFDVSDFKVCYNGSSVGAVVFGADFTGATCISRIMATVVTPDSTYGETGSVGALPEHIGHWISLDQFTDPVMLGDSYTLGGDLVWTGSAFTAFARVEFDDGSGLYHQHMIFGAFRSTDTGITKYNSVGGAVSFRPVTAELQIDTLNRLGRVRGNGGPEAFHTASGTAWAALIPFARSKHRVAAAFNPIDRIFAVAYVGTDGDVVSTGQDPLFTQVMVEYFEENGAPLNLKASDTGSYRGDRQMLYFGGRKVATAGSQAHSPCMIWTGSNFALTFRGIGISAADAEIPEDAVTPLVILHPKEPVILHWCEFAVNDDSSATSDHALVNHELIFDPLTGDFTLAGVADFDIDNGVSGADLGWKTGIIRRLSPVHPIQVTADTVEFDNVSFRSAVFPIRIDMGTRDSTYSARINEWSTPTTCNPLQQHGADPMGMRRVMDTYRVDRLNQRGCMFRFRLLDGNGIDSYDNMNMNGK